MAASRSVLTCLARLCLRVALGRAESLCSLSPPSHKTCHTADNNSEENDQLIKDYGMFVASMEESRDLWTPSMTQDPISWWRAWGREYPVLKKLVLNRHSSSSRCRRLPRLLSAIGRARATSTPTAATGYHIFAPLS